MTVKEDCFANFDTMGEDQVSKLVLSWDEPVKSYGFEWLKLRSEEDRARNEASQAEQLALARLAAAEATQANTIARTSRLIAIIGSAISILIAILTWLLPRT